MAKPVRESSKLSMQVNRGFFALGKSLWVSVKIHWILVNIDLNSVIFYWIAENLLIQI